MVRRLKEDIREVQGGFPKRDRRARRHRRPARRRARARAVAAARRVPHGARGALREHVAPSAGRRRAARRRPPAAAALVDRGVRPQPQGPPRDRRAAVGEGERDAGRRPRRRRDEPQLFTTAPDADDERGELDGRGARGRGGRADRGGHRGRRGRVAPRRRGGSAVAPRAGAARPDAGDRRAERGTCPTPRSAG